MEFVLTPDEAQTTASAVVALFDNEGRQVSVEIAPDAQVGFRPTITAVKDLLTVFVEAQHEPRYTVGLGELVSWASVQRVHCEIFVALPMDATLTARFLAELKRDGVGLLLVSDELTVTTYAAARNPALVVTPDPTLKLGRCRKEVLEEIARFNDVDRAGALRAMCEIVERETDKLVAKLARKKWITKSVDEVGTMDWATQINIAASANVATSGKTPIVGETLKTDLQSFRGARNLIDHKATTKHAEKKRQMQFAERMLMGPRLTAELLALQRKVT